MKSQDLRTGKTGCYKALWLALLVILPALERPVLATTLASPFTLAWDASPDPKAVGYAVYYSLSNSGITNRIETGAARQITLSNFPASSNYFFFVVAYDANGIEGEASGPLFFAPSIVSKLQLTSLADGTMRLQFQAPPGTIYRMEHATITAPEQWQTLVSSTVGVTGGVTVDDPPAGRPPNRFYRVVLP